MKLAELVNTKWAGKAELWLDPAGNEAILCDCTIEVSANEVLYQWSYEGKPQTGRITSRSGETAGADFTDTWHSPSPMVMVPAAQHWALVDVFGTYTADGPPWGWRIHLSRRPDAELVLQMTNVTPWGEEARAVRMICQRT